jgi:alginate O-acetyltransferase complex protein AlgI
MPATGIIFNTYWFVLFALIVVPVYWLLQKAPLRLPFLAIACAVFHYHFAGPAGVLPIIFIGTVTYFCGLSRNRAACVAGIVLSVVALCFYKYTHFLTIDVLGLINPGWGNAALEHAKHMVPGAVLAPATAVDQTFVAPLGMSFFAFEFVHYLYDVRQGHEPIRNPMRFLLFAIFFPSLVAGPIKRYEQYQPSLQRGAEAVNVADVALGLRRIAMGFFKKLVIADNLTLALAFYLPQTGAVTHFVGMTLLSRWLVLGMLGTRMLMDFSGYSDMAIGLARLLGITLPENFNWPYAATSVQEFWQRWHISLSSWIRDYVYIPLGGNRHGIVRKIFNGFTAFALVGLWHGPAWNFVAWGVYHGVGLGVSSNYTAIPRLGPVLKKLADMHRPLCWVVTQLFVWLGWLLFFYPVGPAIKMAGLLFTSGS